jgi:hypothetical protein
VNLDFEQQYHVLRRKSNVYPPRCSKVVRSLSTQILRDIKKMYHSVCSVYTCRFAHTSTVGDSIGIPYSCWYGSQSGGGSVVDGAMVGIGSVGDVAAGGDTWLRTGFRFRAGVGALCGSRPFLCGSMVSRVIDSGNDSVSGEAEFGS